MFLDFCAKVRTFSFFLLETLGLQSHRFESEVLVGYGISLTLSLPISVLVCSERLLGMRQTFGLAFDGENGKGD